jgi:hypothetical protein
MKAHWGRSGTIQKFPKPWAFKTYDELLKTLKAGDIVVLDNLGSPQGKGSAQDDP